MHLQGDPNLDILPIGTHNRSSHVTYSDTKLHDVILAMAVARKWADVYANAVDPGWVPTKMGGAGAPDNLEKGFQTQVWLAVSNDPEANVSGRYFHHKRQDHYLPAAKDIAVQEKFLALCEKITGVRFHDGKS
jgi:NAD(P)-dependent dehydrogenase (short-subunit alcohol dehydrogenase family)